MKLRGEFRVRLDLQKLTKYKINITRSMNAKRYVLNLASRVVPCLYEIDTTGNGRFNLNC